MSESSTTERRSYELTLPALAIEQTAGRTLYSFAVDGKVLPTFAAVSRVKRETTTNSRAISAPSRSPTSARSASTSRPRTRCSRTRSSSRSTRACGSRATTERRNDARPGDWSSPSSKGRPKPRSRDGSSTASSAPPRFARLTSTNFPVYVTAFITDSVAEQRSQFILVNSTKPLPKGLIHELLPATPVGDLPLLLLKKRYPAVLLDRLNYDPDSPLYRRIRTPTTAEGTIKDNSILRLLVDEHRGRSALPVVRPRERHRRHRRDADACQELLACRCRVRSRTPGISRRAARDSSTASESSHSGSVMDEIAYDLREDGVPISAPLPAATRTDRPVVPLDTRYLELRARRSAALERTPEHTPRHQDSSATISFEVIGVPRCEQCAVQPQFRRVGLTATNPVSRGFSSNYALTSSVDFKPSTRNASLSPAHCGHSARPHAVRVLGNSATLHSRNSPPTQALERACSRCRWDVKRARSRRCSQSWRPKA